MRLSSFIAMVKPTPAARSRIILREAADCCGVDPYFCATCSRMFWPSGGMSGFSSNGWKWMSAFTRSPTRSNACSSPFKPMMHQGQTTSETKSMVMVLAWALVMVAPSVSL